MLWYIEHLIKEHPRDALPFWEAELCQSQNQSITTFPKKLLCHPKHHQQKKAFLEAYQQFMIIDNSLLENFHLLFIFFSDLYVETFRLPEIAKRLTLTHDIFQASKIGLSSFLLNDRQSITEIHPDFYDPIGIQLERRFHKKEISSRIPTEISLSDSTFNIDSPRKDFILTMMFKGCICVGIKMKRWFH